MAYTLNRRLAQLVDSNGQLNTGKIPNDYITGDHIADNVITSAMLHTSFTVSTSNLTAIDTDDVSEGSSNLYFTNARADARIAAATTDDLTEGSTNLYFTNERVDDRVNALLTAGTGITLTYDDGANTLTIAGAAQYGDSDVESYLDTNGLTLPDNVKAQFGASNDLQIYHDGSNSYISDNGTGDLRLQGNGLKLINSSNLETYANFVSNGASTFYYDNSAKLATTSTGIDVTGNITVSGTVDGRDLATDGTKLDGIESGATADQTQAEINALGITAIGLSGTPNITVGTISSGVHTITSTGTIGGSSGGAGGYLKIQDGTDTLAFDTNEIHGTEKIFITSEDTEIIFRGLSNVGVVLKNGSTQFMDASRNLTNIGTISSGAITASTSSDYPLKVLSTDSFSGIVIGDNSSTTNGNVIAVVGDSMRFYTGGTTSSDIALTLASNNNATFAGTLEATSFSDGTISGITFIDEDSFATNSATRVPTQQSIKAYVDAQVAGVVDSAPATLDTLNELAAALGDDANFSTTTSTALGNRLRVDTAAQGLTGTQQANAITNLGITATKAELNYVDGVTSNIQTQLDGKQASGSYLTGNQTITLSGDVSGSGTTSIAVTIADDSHNHVISNVDGLQTALDAKLTSSSGLNASNLTSGTIPSARFPDNIFDSYRRDTIDSSSETFNSYTTTGTYHVNNWSESGDVVQNGPTNAAAGNAYGWGVLRVTNWQDSDGSGNTYVLQEYWPHQTDVVYSRILWNGTFTGWRAAWGNENDGSGSGLDADLLDGQHGSYYAPASTALTTSTSFGGDVSGTYNAIVVADDSHNHVISNIDGLQTALDAKLASSSYTAADVLTKIKTVDGPSSGLDADLLDGNQLTGGSGSIGESIFNNQGRSHLTQTNFNDTSLRAGVNYIQGGTNSPTGSGQWYGMRLGLGSQYGTTTGTTGHYASEMYWARKSNVSNYYIYTRDMENGSWGSWQKMYAGYADSAGDADTLDGVQGSSYLRSDAADTMTGKLTASGGIDGLTLANGGISGSNYNITGVNQLTINDPGEGIVFGGGATTVTLAAIDDATDSIMNFSNASELRRNNNKVWDAGNDGAGSGLDADLLDGVQGSSYLRSDASDTFTTLSGTQLNLGSQVQLKESTDRADLLEISSSTSGWAGLQVRNTSNEGRWSFMTDGTLAGIYDDENSDWHVQMTENAGVRLYHNGVQKFTTTANGIEVIEDTNYKGVHIRGNNAPNVTFAQGTSGDGSATWKAGISGNDGAHFSISKGTANDDRLIITDEGAVGINVNPSVAATQYDLLSIKQDRTNTNFFTSRNDQGGFTHRIYADYANAGTTIEYQAACGENFAGVRLQTWTDHPLTLGQNNTEIMRIADNSSSTAPRVGIGLTSPSYNLHVAGSGGAEGTLGVQSVGNSQFRLVADNSPLVAIQGGTGTATSQVPIYFSGMNGSNFTFVADTANQRVGVGTTGPGTKLDVNGGDIRCQAANNDISLSYELPGYGGNSYGNLKASANNIYLAIGNSYVGYINGNGVLNSSDVRLKENIQTLENALDKVIQLRGVSFTWKDAERGIGTKIGFIAQEVEDIYPELVGDGDLPIDEDGIDPIKSVDYAHVVPILVEAIKELKTENDALKARLDAAGL